MNERRRDLERRRQELAERQKVQDVRRRELEERKRLYQKEVELAKEECRLDEEEEWLLLEHERLDHLESGLEYEGEAETPAVAAVEVEPSETNIFLIAAGLLIILLAILSLISVLEPIVTYIFGMGGIICFLIAIWRLFTESIEESGCFKMILVGIAFFVAGGALSLFFESIGLLGNLILIALGVVICLFGFAGALTGSGSDEVHYD